ncbi:MAG: hypothetical protein JSV58_05015 [Candidatus Bathyarchaeota archaeon]|nr:MAG: hypothetical protein JSV58_05015 [Candidatus Bathyarchaeota archaeon]
MKTHIDSLRTKYKRFKSGKEPSLEVRAGAQQALEQATKRKDLEGVEEVQDMIMDLEFSIEENKCKCHRKSPTC